MPVIYHTLRGGDLRAPSNVRLLRVIGTRLRIAAAELPQIASDLRLSVRHVRSASPVFPINGSRGKSGSTLA